MFNKKEWMKQYRIDNKDIIAAKRKEYREKNKESLNEGSKKWREDNKEYVKVYKKGYNNGYKERRNELARERNKIDVLYSLEKRVRANISQALGRMDFTKRSSLNNILGCSFEEFKLHIESKFTEGMSWSNRGEWHLDHIIPISWATTEEEIYKLNHYSNFQPLWAQENLKKQNNYIG